jgi:hypothetical protein
VWVAAALCSVADGFTPKDSMHCVKWMANPPETPIRSEANHGRCAHTTLKLCCATKKLVGLPPPSSARVSIPPSSTRHCNDYVSSDVSLHVAISPFTLISFAHGWPCVYGVQA